METYAINDILNMGVEKQDFDAKKSSFISELKS
jgi:hypothetical protein